MPRKPHFVLAARRWGWPLSPSYGRVRGLMTSVMGWKPKAETASLRVRFTTARPRVARDASDLRSRLLFLWQRTVRMCYSVLMERTDDESRIDR
jgi:hypothetical protein